MIVHPALSADAVEQAYVATLNLCKHVAARLALHFPLTGPVVTIPMATIFTTYAGVLGPVLPHTAHAIVHQFTKPGHKYESVVYDAPTHSIQFTFGPPQWKPCTAPAAKSLGCCTYKNEDGSACTNMAAYETRYRKDTVFCEAHRCLECPAGGVPRRQCNGERLCRHCKGAQRGWIKYKRHRDDHDLSYEEDEEEEEALEAMDVTPIDDIGSDALSATMPPPPPRKRQRTEPASSDTTQK